MCEHMPSILRAPNIDADAVWLNALYKMLTSVRVLVVNASSLCVVWSVATNELLVGAVLIIDHFVTEDN